ncbi:thermonuclease family protein [Candidatus Microgenomates bacterium]|nr:thermonuclease family protein [Candidatus Microgenomates bacterium]
MTLVFFLLFILSLISLVAGLIKPSIFSRILKGSVARKSIGLIFGIASFVFFVGVGLTAPKTTNGATNTNQPKQTKDEANIEASKNQQEKSAEDSTTSLDDTLYLVASVTDGDTIKVEISGKLEAIRLVGIDTPETVDPRKPVQCFGKEASDRAKMILTEQKVRLEKDLTQNERDKYGRLLRFVFLEDGTNFNKKMILDGYAHEYTYQSNPYKYQQEFKEAEKQAIEANRGLWSASACGGDTTQEATTPTQNTSGGSSPTATQPTTPTLPPSTTTTTLPVKKSKTSICHAPGTTYYNQTIYFTPYNTIDECLDSGGRLPLR